MLGYSAINLGYRELNTPPSVLRGIEIKHQMHFLNANILFKETEKPFFQPYVIKEITMDNKKAKVPFKKLKIGIIGLCDNLLAQIHLTRAGEPELLYQDPQEAASKYVGDLRKKVDLIVLLYYGKYDKMKEIVSKVAGIDVVVMGGDIYRIGHDEKDNEKVIIVGAQSMGKYVNILQLALDAKKQIKSNVTKQVPLSEDIPDDPQLANLVKQHDEEVQKPR